MSDKATLRRLLQEHNEATKTEIVFMKEDAILRLFKTIQDELATRAEAAECELTELRERMQYDRDALIDRIQASERELAELKEHTQWIPVSDRLPEDDEIVIFYDRVTEQVRLGRRVGHVLEWYSSSGLYFHGQQYDWVTHWMPLPPPPQET